MDLTWLFSGFTARIRDPAIDVHWDQKFPPLSAEFSTAPGATKVRIYLIQMPIHTQSVL